jgi:glycosyltransferase involved in cell wall biosynthesis
MIRLLYILPGLVPPGEDATRDKFTYLSEIVEGEVLLPVWSKSPESAPAFLRETFPVYRRANFSYHFFLPFRVAKPFRWLATLLFYIRRGLQLHREKKIDVIMTYGTNRPGIAGVILKWLTGAKLIVEIPGAPENAFRYDEPHPGSRSAAKRFLANQLLLLTCTIADSIKLLYPWQLRKYRLLQKKTVAVFHDFVPIRTICAKHCEERYVLLVGFPWHTKGADVLIRAFKSIMAQFPDFTLKLMGHYPDREYLDKLAGGSPQIEFLKPGPYELALKVIGACTVYVSASRTEGVPRILLEAMAARKPIIASAVAGVPYLIKDNDDGLLFESENVEELAAKLGILLRDRELQARLAKRAYEKVISEYDEQSYVRAFRTMLQSI